MPARKGVLFLTKATKPKKHIPTTILMLIRQLLHRANIHRLCHLCIIIHVLLNVNTTLKVSKYGVISGPYFPKFGLNNSAFGHFSRSTLERKFICKVIQSLSTVAP